MILRLFTFVRYLVVTLVDVDSRFLYLTLRSLRYVPVTLRLVPHVYVVDLRTVTGSFTFTFYILFFVRWVGYVYVTFRSFCCYPSSFVLTVGFTVRIWFVVTLRYGYVRYYVCRTRTFYVPYVRFGVRCAATWLRLLPAHRTFYLPVLTLRSLVICYSYVLYVRSLPPHYVTHYHTHTFWLIQLVDLRYRLIYVTFTGYFYTVYVLTVLCWLICWLFYLYVYVR